MCKRILPSHLPTKGYILGSITVTHTPGKRPGTAVHGQVYTAGGRQDAPGAGSGGRSRGVRNKGKPEFIRGKGWGISVSMGQPVFRGGAVAKQGAELPPLVQQPSIWATPGFNPSSVVGGGTTSNKEELLVAQAKADQQRVRKGRLVGAPPTQVACNY